MDSLSDKRGPDRTGWDRTTRRVLGLALLGFLVFVIYGSLVPLEFRYLPLRDAVQSFREIRYLDLEIRSRADWVANLLLFIPLAYLGTGFLWRPGKRLRNGVATIAVLLGCAGLTTAIEFVQLYFPQRTVSLNDMVAESLGGVLGVAAWWMTGPRATIWLSGRLSRTGSLALSEIGLYTYLFVKFAYDLLPLDLTLSPVEVFHKWQAGRVHFVPFGFAFSSPETALYGLAADIAAWIPAGLLARLATRAPDRTVWMRLVGAAIVLEFLQLWVYSRVTDSTDILAAGVGVLFGILIGRRRSTRSQREERTIESRGRLAWLALLAGWIVVLTVVFWYPFETVADPGLLREKLRGFFRIPFTTYYYTSEYMAITQVLRRLAFFALLGALLGYPLIWIRGRDRRRLWILLAAVVSSGIALIVELGQVAFADKVADVTDWILECLGGFGGLVAVVWVVRSRLQPGRPPEEVPAVRPSGARVQGAAPLDSSQVSRWSPGGSFPLALLGFGVFAVALAFLLLARIPTMPYNVRELLRPGYPLLSAVLFSLFVFWSFATPVWFGRRVMRRRRVRYRMPLFVLAHGAVAYALLRGAVPVESIHDIVGSPSRGALSELEMLARFEALFAVFSLALILGAIGTRVLGRRRWTGAISAALAWWVALGILSYVIVVPGARTDNLTELIAGDGSLLGAACLALYWVVVSGTASLLAAAPWNGFRHLVPAAAAATVVSVPLGYGLASLGTEAQVHKYGKTFSALQFLLSTGRDDLSAGSELVLRYMIFHALLLAAIALAQSAVWGRIAWLDSRSRHRRSGRLGRPPGNHAQRRHEPKASKS